jgi:hypothetical protein
MTDQFKHLFEQTLSTASFVPARPDRLPLDLEPERGVARQSTIADAGLRLQLYRTSPIDRTRITLSLVWVRREIR